MIFVQSHLHDAEYGSRIEGPFPSSRSSEGFLFDAAQFARVQHDFQNLALGLHGRQPQKSIDEPFFSVASWPLKRLQISTR